MVSKPKILLAPIGYVKTDAVGDQVRNSNIISKIVLNASLAEGLEGITEFSHVFVVFFMNQIEATRQMALKVHPRGRIDMPLVGLFATRTYMRPNPIGLTLVELLGVEGNVLTVRGLDAFDGTPVLDIKPADPWDATAARVPDWWLKLNSKKR
jgi:tRNA-Thr(GGU) m(6)t(6)A37 methyltransferase TsaA